MKKLKFALTMLALGAVLNMPQAEAADGASCVFLKFSDDTRYEAIDAAQTLSDLVVEKMMETGQFALKETKPIDAGIQKKLYDENNAIYEGIRQAMNYGDYNAMFEGAGFNEKYAQSIATAGVGQFVAPQLTSQIGSQHGVKYLIQGTIINLGTGGWWDEDLMNMAQYTSMLTSYVGGMGGAGLGQLGGILGSISSEKAGIGVQCDMRIIEARSGEVVWVKRVTAVADKSLVSANVPMLFGAKIKVGSAKLDNELYSKAMDLAAQKIVDELVADNAAGKFLK
jgi:hypothetical protein